MRLLGKTALMVGLAGAMALGTMTASEARGGRNAAAIGAGVAGFAVGAAVGSAAAANSYGYYGGSPGYYQEDKTYYVETNIYSLKSNKLLWSGTTSSLNPSKLDQTIDDIINTLRAQMQKQGLIK